MLESLWLFSIYSTRLTTGERYGKLYQTFNQISKVSEETDDPDNLGRCFSVRNSVRDINLVFQ